MSNGAGALLDCCLRAAHGVWPWTCVLCGNSGSRETGRGKSVAFCSGCAASLPLLPRVRCELCALPLTSGATCGACLRERPAYDAVVAAFAYEFPIDALIQRYKYGGDLSLVRVLGDALSESVRGSDRVLIPMPLAASRLRERGFNQAQELARHLARTLRLRVLHDGVRKIVDTPPQAALPWKARARNVRKVFVCDADLSGLHVAVVDDVITTGATLNELARNLKRAGAASVAAWVVARTLRARDRATAAII